MNDNIENFLIALQVMWQGMLGIFVVMIVLTLIVQLMIKLQKKES
jgi:Oxaloacetate decarboxylase, gamma chain.